MAYILIHEARVFPAEFEMVRFQSHRARERSERVLGGAIPSFHYSVAADHGYLVPAKRVPELLRIPGVKPYPKWREKDWRPNWSSGAPERPTYPGAYAESDDQPSPFPSQLQNPKRVITQA